MNQPRFPDPTRSRALLIGASHFTAAGSDLPDIPAVEANLTALRQVLTSPDTGVLRPELCRVLADPTSTDGIGVALSDAAATATDLLLVYYAGHGLVDDRGRLHLAVAHTQPHRARWTALPLDLLREEIANSPAATRVLVLDCCFSGRAIEAMADNQGVISGQLDVTGTYTLTSTTANAPAGDRHTAFTGALLRALDQADPLTLDQIYIMVDRDLVARNLPRPQRHAVNAAGDLALTRGPTLTPGVTEPRTDQPDSDALQVTFTYTWAGAMLAMLLAFRFVVIFAFIPIFGLVLSLVGEYTSSSSLIFGVILSLFITGGLFALFARFAVVSRQREDHISGLVVDRSGLTLQWKRVRTHLSWHDITQVGMLQPESRSLNPRVLMHRRERTNILVVRLRTEVPAPGFVSVLSDEHRQLGYLGLCSLEDIGSSRQNIINALERFAGGRLVRSSRQFLDRDPRLRPDVV